MPCLVQVSFLVILSHQNKAGTLTGIALCDGSAYAHTGTCSSSPGARSCQHQLEPCRVPKRDVLIPPSRKFQPLGSGNPSGYTALSTGEQEADGSVTAGDAIRHVYQPVTRHSLPESRAIVATELAWLLLARRGVWRRTVQKACLVRLQWQPCLVAEGNQPALYIDSRRWAGLGCRWGHFKPNGGTGQPAILPCGNSCLWKAADAAGISRRTLPFVGGTGPLPLTNGAHLHQPDRLAGLA